MVTLVGLGNHYVEGLKDMICVRRQPKGVNIMSFAEF